MPLSAGTHLGPYEILAPPLSRYGIERREGPIMTDPLKRWHPIAERLLQQFDEVETQDGWLSRVVPWVKKIEWVSGCAKPVRLFTARPYPFRPLSSA